MNFAASVQFAIFILLTTKQNKTKIVSAIVLFRVENCNSLLSGCPKHPLEKLQNVQKSAARLVSKLVNEITFHPSSELYWLPIQARIKSSTLCLLFINLSDLFHAYSSPRQLRCLLFVTQNLYTFHTLRPKHLDITLLLFFVRNSSPREIKHIQSATEPLSRTICLNLLLLANVFYTPTPPCSQIISVD